MLQAMNTGHEGSITTVHANDTRDALSRLEVMVGMAGAGVCPEASEKDDAVLLQPPAKAAKTVVAAAKAAALAAALAAPKARSFPTRMEPLTPLPAGPPA